MDVIDKIRRNGVPLGEPNRLLPARADFIRLHRQVPRDRLLVAIYGDETHGFSASPMTEFGTFKIIRRSSRGQIKYYLVQKGAYSI